MPATPSAHHGLHRGYASREGGWGPNMTADLLRVDSMLTRSVKSRAVNNPGSLTPSDGDRYLVGTSPVGAWSGQAKKFAVYDSLASAWVFYTPEDGWNCFVADESVWVEYGNGTWWELTEINAAKFSSVAAAFAAVPTSGAIFFPPGTWSVPSAITLQTNGVKVRGIKDRSILQATANPTFHMLTVNAFGFEMHNMVMDGGYSAPTAGAYDVLRIYATGGHGVADHLFRRVTLQNAARHNLYMSDVYEMYFHECTMQQAHNNAATGENHYGTFIEFANAIVNNTHVEFKSCGFHNNDGGGAYLKSGTAIDFDHCRFETNRGGTTAGEANGLRVGSTTGVRVDKTHFELSVALPPASRPESLLRCDNSGGIVVERNTFEGSSTAGIQPTYLAFLGNCAMGHVRRNRCQHGNGVGIQADLVGGEFIASVCDSTSPDVIAGTNKVPYIGANGVNTATGQRLPQINGSLPTAAIGYRGDILYDLSDDKAKVCAFVSGAWTWKALW